MALEKVGGKTDPPLWATEDTLNRLVDLTQTGVQFRKEDAGKGSRAAAKESATQTKRIKGLGKEIDKSLGKNREFLKNAFNDIIKSSIVGGASIETRIKNTLQKQLVNFTDWLSDLGIFGKILAGVFAIGIVAFRGLITVVQQALTGFFDLYDTGVSLNGSFISLIDAAGQFKIGVIDFIEALKSHSQAIVRLSTESNTGARAFAELQYAVRKNIKEHNFFGLSIAETSEFLGEYLETQKTAGFIQKLQTQQTSAVVADYIKQITKLSHFTGERRKQVQSEVEAVIREESLQLALSNMSQEMQLEARKFLGISRVYGESAFQAAQEEIIFQVSGMSEATGKWVTMNPVMARAMHEMAETFRSGNKITEQAQEDFVRLYNKHGKEFVKAYGPSLAAIARLDPAFAKALEGSLRARNLTVEQFRKEIGFNDGLTEFYAQFENLKQEFVSNFIVLATKFMQVLEKHNVLDTIFGNLEIGLTRFNTWLTGIVTMLPGGPTQSQPGQSGQTGSTQTGQPAAQGPGAVLSNLASLVTGGGSLQQLGASFLNASGVMNSHNAINALIDEQVAAGFKKPTSAQRSKLVAQLLAQVDRGLFDNLESAIKGHSTLLGGPPYFAKGGIARVPSVFGEAGPEVAIPLTSGERIPVAEVKRPISEIKTFEDIRSLLEDIKERTEFTAREAQIQSNTLKQIERKTGKDSSHIF